MQNTAAGYASLSDTYLNSSPARPAGNASTSGAADATRQPPASPQQPPQKGPGSHSGPGTSSAADGFIGAEVSLEDWHKTSQDSMALSASARPTGTSPHAALKVQDRQPAPTLHPTSNGTRAPVPSSQPPAPPLSYAQLSDAYLGQKQPLSQAGSSSRLTGSPLGDASSPRPVSLSHVASPQPAKSAQQPSKPSKLVGLRASDAQSANTGKGSATDTAGTALTEPLAGSPAISEALSSGQANGHVSEPQQTGRSSPVDVFPEATANGNAKLQGPPPPPAWLASLSGTHTAFTTFQLFLLRQWPRSAVA